MKIPNIFRTVQYDKYENVKKIQYRLVWPVWKYQKYLVPSSSKYENAKNIQYRPVVRKSQNIQYRQVRPVWKYQKYSGPSSTTSMKMPKQFSTG